MRRLISKISDGKYERLEESSPIDESRFQDILESGKAPGPVTDRELLEGTYNKSEFADNPRYAKFLEKQYRLHSGGKAPPTGSVYMSNLCRHGMPGDPEAWVDGRGDVKRLLEKRGAGADCPLMFVPEREKPPRKPKKLADHIVHRLVNNELAVNPKADRRELREKVIATHGNPNV